MPIARQVDIILSKRDELACALLAWTGSKLFERDLRMHAASLNMKFNENGLVIRKETGEDERILATVTEEDVFDKLHLRWIPPEMRNC